MVERGILRTRPGTVMSHLILLAALPEAFASGLADCPRTFDTRDILEAVISTETAERADYRAELEGMQSGANGLSYGCYVAAGAGVAFGAVAAVTW